MIGCLPTQALAFLAVFVYATHATKATAFGWKPGFRLLQTQWILVRRGIKFQAFLPTNGRLYNTLALPRMQLCDLSGTYVQLDCMVSV